jgi:hypothetical protein
MLPSTSRPTEAATGNPLPAHDDRAMAILQYGIAVIALAASVALALIAR